MPYPIQSMPQAISQYSQPYSPYAPYAPYGVRPAYPVPYYQIPQRVVYVPYVVSLPPAPPAAVVNNPIAPTPPVAPSPLSPLSEDAITLKKPAVDTISSDDKRLLEVIRRARENNPKLKALFDPNNLEKLEEGLTKPENSLKLILDSTISDSIREELHHKRWWHRNVARSGLNWIERIIRFMPIPKLVKTKIHTYFEELRTEKPVSKAVSKKALDEGV